MSKKTEGLLAINLAAILFGTAALYGRLDVSPVWIVAIRSFFALSTLLLLAKFKSQLLMPAKRVLPLAALTGIILCIHWLTFFASVQLAGIAIATLTFAAFPLFTILMEAFQKKARPYWVEVIAGLTILCAVNLLVDANMGKTSEIVGTLAGIFAAFMFAIFGVLSKKLTNHVPAITLSLLQNGIVFLILLPALPFIDRAPSDARDWICLLLLGVVTTALMHQLYLYALNRLSAATCGGFVALEPIYAILFAFLFFNEPITFVVAISSALIFSASLMLLSSENRLPEKKPGAGVVGLS